MNTALQELIEELDIARKIVKGDNIEYIHFRVAINTAIDLAQEKLEKEKQQIIEAHNFGMSANTWGVTYYEETYGSISN